MAFAGELRATHGSDIVVLRAVRDTLTVDLPRGVFLALTSISRTKRRTRFLPHADRTLRPLRLTLEVRFGRRTVALVGVHARPGLLGRLLGRLLGVGPIELRPVLLMALFAALVARER